MPNAGVIFDGDTQRFRAEVDAAGNSVSKASIAIASAKNKILDSFNAQAEAAAETGASAEKLARIQTKAAQQMANVTEDNANKVINSLDRIAARQKAVTAELGNLSVPEAQETSDITNRMRASALLKGGGLRAAENFASQFAAFNSIAAAAFPVLGLVSLTEEAVKMGKALYDAFDMGGKRARQTEDEVRGVDVSLRDSSTSLDVQMDKLQQEAAKIAKKPFNGLKLALDEAAEASERLQSKLSGVLQTELKVIAGMSASMPQRILTGGSSTQQEQVMLEQHNKWLTLSTSAQGQYNESVSYGTALQQRLVELQQKQQQNAAATLAASRQGAVLPLTNYKEEIEATKQLISWQQSEQDTIKKSMDIDAQQVANQTAEDAARTKRDAADAARARAAAGNRAAEQKLHDLEAYVEAWKLAEPVTAKAIYDYWEVQKSAFRAGSEQFRQIVQKQVSIAVEAANKFHEALAKFKAEQVELANLKVPDHAVNVLGNNASTSSELGRAQAQARLAGAEEDAQVARTRVQIAESTGAISKLAATQQLAAIDANLHAERLADLNAQIAELKKNSASYNPVADVFGSDKDQRQYVELQSQVTKETAQQTIDTMKSAAEISGQAWQTSLTNAMQTWAQNARNVAQQVQQLFTQAIDGVNDNLSNLLTGQKTHWGQMFQGLGKSMVTDGLKQGEAALFGHALGKPDGTSSNPLNVKIVGGDDSDPSSGGGLFGKLLGGGGSGDDGDSGGGGFSGLVTSLFGGGKAVGGSVTAGTTYLVGERGPELFSPGASGMITPNHALGGYSPTFNVSIAHGVTPEQVRMAVVQGARESHAAALKDMHEMQRNGSMRR